MIEFSHWTLAEHHEVPGRRSESHLWIPACAGMTEKWDTSRLADTSQLFIQEVTMITLVRSLFISFSLLVVTASCADKSAAPAKTEAKTEHAAEGVKPGSHEDWCGEHGVAESQCTRCNPSLTAAFKASNDWCAEHDLPESQCKKCNPDLKIERPPKGN
jgi:hypothetical protein